MNSAVVSTDKQNVVPDSSPVRFFESLDGPVLRTVGELDDRLHPDPVEFLSNFSIPQKYLPLYETLLSVEGRRMILARMACRDLLQLSWDPQLHELMNEFGVRRTWDALLSNRGNYRRFSYMPDFAALSTGESTGFNATFVDFNCLPFSEEAAYIPDFARVFGMYLPDSEMEAVRRDCGILPREVVPNAFGSIRYQYLDLKGWNSGGAIVTDIRSEYFDKIQSAELRARYNNWGEQLLTAFEWHQINPERGNTWEELAAKRDVDEVAEGRIPIALLFHSDFKPKDVPAEERVELNPNHAFMIFVVTSEFAKGRDEEYVEIDSPFQVATPESYKFRFEALPQALDYRPLLPFNPDHPFEGKTLDCRPVSAFWARDVSNPISHRSACLAAFGLGVIEESAFSRFHPWIELNYQLFPHHVSHLLVHEGYRLTHPNKEVRLTEVSEQIARHFAEVPVTRVPLKHIPGCKAEWADTLQAELGQPKYQPFLAALTPDFVQISRSVAEPLPASWWEIQTPGPGGLLARAFHAMEQGRHPFIRTTSNRDGNLEYLSLGIKGGGLREVRLDEITIPEGGHEFYMPIHFGKPAGKDEPDVPSHRYWGGMNEFQARLEMLQAVALLHLQRSAAPHMDLGTPVPLDFNMLLKVPVFLPEGPSEIDALDYMTWINGSDVSSIHDRLACFRSFSPGDVRLSGVVNRIFERDAESQNSLYETQRQILQSLNYLYALYGQQFTAPAGLSILPNNGKVGFADISNYLSAIGEEQSDAAALIHANFLIRTIHTIGLVHGAGGHLGGGRINQVGAVGGGATTIRNIDAAGVIHDLDADLWLPWVYREGSNQGWENFQRENISFMQSADLTFWCETMYWLEQIVYGRLGKAGVQIQEFHFGSKYNKLRFFNDGTPGELPPISVKDGGIKPPDEIWERLGVGFSLKEASDIYHQAWLAGREYKRQI